MGFGGRREGGICRERMGEKSKKTGYRGRTRPNKKNGGERKRRRKVSEGQTERKVKSGWSLGERNGTSGCHFDRVRFSSRRDRPCSLAPIGQSSSPTVGTVRSVLKVRLVSCIMMILTVLSPSSLSFLPFLSTCSGLAMSCSAALSKPSNASLLLSSNMLAIVAPSSPSQRQPAF